MNKAPVNAEAREYRADLYARYGEWFQGRTSFDPEAACKWAEPYRHYLRCWLPTDLECRIAEVGCGSGALLEGLRRWGYRGAVGVDRSPDQVAVARSAGLDVVEGDATEFLQGNRASFDLIVGLDVIEHMTKGEALSFLSASYAALRTSGRLVLQTPNGDSPFCTASRYGDLTHETCFTPSALLRLMKRAGFRAVDSRETAPVVHGIRSFVRAVMWRVLRTGIICWNLVETGGPGSGVFTRNFLATGVR